MTSDQNALPDRARSMALSDAAQALRANSRVPAPAPAEPQHPVEAGGESVMATGTPGPKGHRPRRHRPSRRSGDGGQTAAEEALALLAEATQELGRARREIDRLRDELDTTRAQLLDQTQEAALMRRQRDGLQHRTDYLEEKLELVTRAWNRARAPWWRRRSA